MQRAVEHVGVGIAEGIEAAVDPARKALVGVAGAEQVGGHHRRERERDGARDRDGAGQREGELAEERTGQAALETDRGVNRSERERHRDDRADEFAGAQDRGLHGTEAGAEVTLDVFDDDDGVVDHETDREHDGEQREEVHGKPENLHEENAADERHGNRQNRHQHRAHGAEEEEDHDNNDDERLNQRAGDLADGVADVFRGIVADACRQAAGQILLERVEFHADAFDHINGVGLRERKDADEDRGLAGEAHAGVVILGAEHDVGDVFEAHNRVVGLADDEALELGGRVEIGVGGEVDLDERALGGADGGEVIVGGERGADLGRADVERGHDLGLEPDAHREGAGAENLGALHAGHGGEARLNDADEVVGDLTLVEDIRGEAKVGGGKLGVG